MSLGHVLNATCIDLLLGMSFVYLREADCKHQALNGKSKFLILFIFLPKVALDK